MKRVPSVNLIGQPVTPALDNSVSSAGHSSRAHSKFSASGAERWFKCPGSVKLSEGLPDKPSPYAEEGTRAHEILELAIKRKIEKDEVYRSDFPNGNLFPDEMFSYAKKARDFIVDRWQKFPHSTIQAEQRADLTFIHPEAFGTFDAAIIEPFGTLDVFDFKYGAGVSVSPIENLQMIFYGLGLAHKYQWNFKRVLLWIIQPRIKGYDGPVFWELPILKLKGYIPLFKESVHYVLNEPETYVEGSWCHWCKAKSICPAKLDKKAQEAKRIFTV